MLLLCMTCSCHRAVEHKQELKDDLGLTHLQAKHVMMHLRWASPLIMIVITMMTVCRLHMERRRQ